METAPHASLDVPQAVFDALADPTRRTLIERLAVRVEPISITELAELFPISRQAVSKHVATLEAAGLVQSERRGRERMLAFSPAPLSDASAWLAAIEARWDARLSALQRYLTEEAGPSDPDTGDQATRTAPQ